VPRSPGSYSAHEAQVVLKTAKPSGVGRAQFEDYLRGLLATEGPLVAWQIISPPGASVYTMIAEYYDAGIASWAVENINGRVIGEDVSITFPFSDQYLTNIT